MNLTDDYCQGAVIACQKLVDFDLTCREIDLAEQQPHIQSQVCTGSSLYPDYLHKQGCLGTLWE